MIVALCPLDETLIRYASGDLDDSVAANQPRLPMMCSARQQVARFRPMQILLC